MQCLARNRNLKRCINEGGGRSNMFCYKHRSWPLVLLFAFCSTIGLIGGLYQDILRPTSESFFKEDSMIESPYNKLILDRKTDFPNVKYTGFVDNSMFEINCPIVSKNTNNIFIEFEIEEDILPEVDLIWVRVTRRKNNNFDSGGYIISDTQYLPREGSQKIRLLNKFSDGYFRIKISVHCRKDGFRPYHCFKKCDYYFSNDNNKFNHQFSLRMNKR